MSTGILDLKQLPQPEQHLIWDLAAFTWSFVGVTEEQLEPLKKNTRYRRLINLYFGWYACFLAQQRRSKTRPPMNKKALEAAFPVDMARTSISINRTYVTKGEELMGNTYVTYEKGKNCRLHCHEEPQSYLADDGRYYYSVPVTIHYNSSMGDIEAEFQMFLKTTLKGKLLLYAAMPLRLRGIYNALPLYHWVGSHFGPFAFLNQYSREPTLFDR